MSLYKKLVRLDHYCSSKPKAPAKSTLSVQIRQAERDANSYKQKKMAQLNHKVSKYITNAMESWLWQDRLVREIVKRTRRGKYKLALIKFLQFYNDPNVYYGNYLFNTVIYKAKYNYCYANYLLGRPALAGVTGPQLFKEVLKHLFEPHVKVLVGLFGDKCFDIDYRDGAVTLLW